MGRGQMQGRNHAKPGVGNMNMKQPRRNMPPNQMQQQPNQAAGLLPLPLPSQMMSQQNNRYMNMNQPGMPNQPNFNQRPMMQPNPMGMGLMPNPNQPPPQPNNMGDNQSVNFNQQQRPLMGINMNRQRNLVNIVTSLPDQVGQPDMFSQQQQFQQPPPSLPGQFQQPPPQFQQPPPQFQQPPPSFQPQQPPPQFQSNQFGLQQPPPGMMMPPGASSNNMQQQTRGLKRSCKQFTKPFV